MRAVDAIIDRLYDGASDDAAWASGLGSVCDAVGAGHLVSLVQERGKAALPLTASARVDPALMARFADTARFGFDLIRHFEERRSFDFDAVIPRAALLRSDFFNEVIRPMGGYRALMAVPFRQDGYDSFIAVCRPAAAEDFGTEEAAILDRIVPHLTRAMRVRLRLADASQRIAAMLGAFDQLATGIAIVNLEMKPVVLNRRVERLIAQADGLTVTGGALAATSPTGTSWLRRLVQRAASDDPRIAGWYTLSLERPERRPPWSIGARLLPPGEGLGGQLVVLTVEEVERQAADLAPVLAAAFGLTAREAALAAELANGNDLTTASARLGIAIGTTRNHLKAIFRKTATHRQAELVTVLLRAVRLG